MMESMSLRDLITGEKSIQAFLNVYLVFIFAWHLLFSLKVSWFKIKDVFNISWLKIKDVFAALWLKIKGVFKVSWLKIKISGKGTNNSGCPRICKHDAGEGTSPLP